MFPDRHRGYQENRYQAHQPNVVRDMIAFFRDDNGGIDMDKVMEVTHQIHQVYDDVKPLLQLLRKMNGYK